MTRLTCIRTLAVILILSSTFALSTSAAGAISVAITFPTPASTVVNPVPIDAAASASGGVERVDLYIDGIYQATDSIAPFSWKWNAAGYSGDHTITVKAYELGTGAEAVDSLRVTIQPICRANFDGVGGVQVQDIFAFLGAWFAGDPRADFDGSGDIAIADIFAYIDAWFAGCP